MGDQELKFTLVDPAIEDVLETENASEEDIKIKDLFQEILIGKDKKNTDKLEIEAKFFKNAKSAAYFKVDETVFFQQMTQSMGQANFDMPINKHVCSAIP